MQLNCYFDSSLYFSIPSVIKVCSMEIIQEETKFYNAK